MADSFQFNKTSMQEFQKQLKVRTQALPVLKGKESALRLQVLRQKQDLHEIDIQYKQKIGGLEGFSNLWTDLPKDFVFIREVDRGSESVAGVRVPTLKKVSLGVVQYDPTQYSVWIAQALPILSELAEMRIKMIIWSERIKLLEDVRKKTSRKVNLYEKVQIPQFTENIRRIKRYLEDVENLDKAAQKISKARLALAEASA